MDYTAEERLRQQAHEVWLHYACPACDVTRSAPPVRLREPVELSSDGDGPCSVLPFFTFSSTEPFHQTSGKRPRPTRQ